MLILPVDKRQWTLFIFGLVTNIAFYLGTGNLKLLMEKISPKWQKTCSFCARLPYCYFKVKQVFVAYEINALVFKGDFDKTAGEPKVFCSLPILPMLQVVSSTQLNHISSCFVITMYCVISLQQRYIRKMVNIYLRSDTRFMLFFA